MCIVFELFCLVNNFMIWKREKERKTEKKKETFNGGVRIRTRNIWITKLAPYRWATETSYYSTSQNMYLYWIWRLGPYDLRPVQSHNSNFDSKNLIKCIIKVVNVSKSQYYEFRHNIMNLGNQNSKYSWRIRDLENPQTGTQFANSVLMYKILTLILSLILTLKPGLSTFENCLAWREEPKHEEKNIIFLYFAVLFCVCYRQIVYQF